MTSGFKQKYVRNWAYTVKIDKIGDKTASNENLSTEYAVAITEWWIYTVFQKRSHL